MAHTSRFARPAIAGTAALALLVGAAGARSCVADRIDAIARRRLSDIEARLDVRIAVADARAEGWSTAALANVVVRDAGGAELLRAASVRVRAGLGLLGWRPAVVVRALEVEAPVVAVGADLVAFVRRRAEGPARAPGGDGAGRAAAGRAPRIDLFDATLQIERPGDLGHVEWRAPLVTVEGDEAGRLSGRAELDAGPGMPFSVALSGRATADAFALQVEGATPLRPPVLAEWLGRTVGFRAFQVDGAGLTLKEVEVSVPAGQGAEVMARLPTLQVRLPGDGGPRVELSRPWVRIERYADGGHNLADLLGVGRWNAERRTPFAGGEQEDAAPLVHRPALRIAEGDLTFVDYRQDTAPVSIALRRLDLRVTPAIDGYEATATWNPERGAGVLAAAGRLVDDDDFDVRVDFESLDLRHLGDGGPARVLGGRADGGLHLRGRGEALRATGRVRLDALGVQWPLLSRLPVEGLDAVADVDVSWDRATGEVRLANLAASLGGTELTAWGVLSDARRPERYDIHLVVGPAPCDDIVASLPAGLRPELADLRLDGHVTLRLRAQGRRDDLDTLELTVDSELQGFAVRRGGPDIAALSRPFVHDVRLGDGVRSGRRVSVDPDVAGFTPYDDTNVFLRAAIVASEDVGFWRHQGFDLRQIGASIARNLRTGEALRGGSTVTQQLVKNLFLGGEKTVARKLQEAFLTWRVEEALDKRRILEIYMNVVEWGPGVYGVRDAAWRYFRKRPRHLSLRESAFLAAILPNPRLLGAADPSGLPLRPVRTRMDRIIRRMQLLGHLTDRAGEGAAEVRLHEADAPAPPALTGLAALR